MSKKIMTTEQIALETKLMIDGMVNRYDALWLEYQNLQLEHKKLYDRFDTINQKYKELKEKMENE